MSAAGLLGMVRAHHAADAGSPQPTPEAMGRKSREAGLEYRHTVVRDADECSQSLDGWQQHYQQLGRGSFVNPGGEPDTWAGKSSVSAGLMALPRCDTWPHAVKTPIRPKTDLIQSVASMERAQAYVLRRGESDLCALLLSNAHQNLVCTTDQEA